MKSDKKEEQNVTLDYSFAISGFLSVSPENINLS